jgi:cellulose synthase/poly-beta-1,6-N-acetylglucosamine synthase-like glycosyltransferase
MIALLELAALFVAGFFVVYLTALSVLALFVRPKREFPAARKRRFALVVPAHNEELSIARTLASLLAIDYPKELFTVIVVADNCTDATASLARSAGANVRERTDTTLRGKGYALRWCFDQILRETPPYDAVVVIDADSIASANFLTVMNHYLERGAGAIQCSDMVAPLPGAWSSEVTRLGFTLYNHVRPLARSLFGFSAGLRGNGMCFSAATLRDHPWNTYSLNEDLEYGLVLLLRGVPVVFAPEALVLATMPATAANAESQRSRWERGRFPVIRRYTWPLVALSARTLSLRPLDALIELIIPPFVNLIAAILALTLLTAVLSVTGYSGAFSFLVAWEILLVLGVAHVLIGLVAAGADRDLYRTLLAIPRYAVWKLLLYTKFVRRRPSTEWVRTTRERVNVPQGHDGPAGR